MKQWTIHEGDARHLLPDLADESVDCVVTSPPYWRMRDYGHPSQLGRESSLEEYVTVLGDLFDQVQRVLVPSGTCWINIGDCYANSDRTGPDLKQGDLVGVPWALAFELRRRGWFIRGEQIWHKTNAHPEGECRRPWRTHEHLFLFTRRPVPEYYYDTDAVRTPLAPKTLTVKSGTSRATVNDPTNTAKAHRYCRTRKHKIDASGNPLGAPMRSVWPLAANSNRGRREHSSMMPDDMPRFGILLGCPPGGRVLDPFTGMGGTGLVALQAGRTFVGFELRSDYAATARGLLIDDAPLFNTPAIEQPSS